MGEAEASSFRVLHITTQVPSDAGERGWMHETAGQRGAFEAVTRHHVRPAHAAGAGGGGGRGAVRDREPARAGDDRGHDDRADGGRRARAGARHARRPRRRSRRGRPGGASCRRRQAPLVFAGGGGRLAADRVVALAEALDAPVVTSFNGKGVLPPGHPLHAGSSWRSRRSAADRGVRRLRRAGHPLRRGVHLPLGGAIPGALVQVDLDPARIGRNYPVRRGHRADVGLFCDALLAAAPGPAARDGAAAARAALCRPAGRGRRPRLRGRSAS